MGRRKGPKGKRRRKPSGYNLALSDYTTALDSLEAALTGDVGQLGAWQGRVGTEWAVMAEKPSDAVSAEYTLERMREARLFVLSPEQYGAWHRAADVYTTEEIAGLDYRGTEERLLEGIPEAEVALHVDKIVRAGVDVPFPDRARWPFPTMWFGYRDSHGLPLGLTREQLALRIGAMPVDGYMFVSGRLVGHLVAADSSGPVMLELVEGVAVPQPDEQLWKQSPALAMMKGLTDGLDRRKQGFFWDTAYSGNEWHSPYTLIPWITTALFAYLADFRQFVMEQTFPRQQRAPGQRRGEPLGDRPIPPPYYLLKLRPHTIHEEARQHMTPRRTWRLRHRADVMGHERVRIRRGRAPLDSKLRSTLLRRGYRVYDGRLVKPYDAPRLAERDIRLPAAGEWLAVKVSWVKDHQRGPADGRYVPALRVAG